MRCTSAMTGWFSPISISLRTTVISLSRSSREMCELTMRSASIRSSHSRVSGLVAKLAK